MAKKLTPYQKEVKNLKQRIHRLEKQGYNFDEMKIPRSTAKVKSLRGKSLKAQGTLQDTQATEHIDGVAPTPADIIYLIAQRIDDTDETLSKLEEYNNYFYPYKEHARRSKGINGMHGGSYVSDIKQLFSEIVESKDAEELQAYSEYLMTIQERLLELIDWNNTKVKYAEEVEAKVAEIISLLKPNDNSLASAYNLSGLYNELSE